MTFSLDTVFRPICVVVIAALTASGCLPIPERVYDTPEIQGSIRKDRAPIANIAIALVDKDTNASCNSPTARTLTDSSGSFFFQKRTHWLPFFVLLPVHQSQEWSLCVQVGGGTVELADTWSYQMGSGVERVRLKCEIARLSDSTALKKGLATWNDPVRSDAPCVDVG